MTTILSEPRPKPRWTAPAALAELALCVVICFAAAGVGSLLTTPNLVPWYAGLAKPAFNPPNAAFAPVWTVLFALMALALWRVWVVGEGAARTKAAGVFLLQLALNIGWSAAFFALRSPWFAFVVILALIAAIVATMLRFRAIDRTAGWLLAPYLAWVSFAAVLNLSTALLN